MPAIATSAGLVALCIALVVARVAFAQTFADAAGSATPIVLIDSNGKVAGRALSDTVVLISVERDVVAPASIRPYYDADGGMASGLAAWQSGGSVLFTSPDCTAGAYVHGGAVASVRAASQVQGSSGVVLYAGEIGMPTTVDVRSILYDTGCAPISVRQNGLFAVVAKINLSVTFPAPLSMR